MWSKFSVPLDLSFLMETLFCEQSPPSTPNTTHRDSGNSTDLIGEKTGSAGDRDWPQGPGPAEAELGGASHILILGKINGFFSPFRPLSKCHLCRQAPSVCLVWGQLTPLPTALFTTVVLFPGLCPMSTKLMSMLSHSCLFPPLEGRPGQLSIGAFSILSPACHQCLAHNK